MYCCMKSGSKSGGALKSAAPLFLRSAAFAPLEAGGRGDCVFTARARARAAPRPARELLPATMESYYTSCPLVLVTADRPRRFTHSNAPQTCIQKGLFGPYAPDAHDLEKDELLDLSAWKCERRFTLMFASKSQKRKRVQRAAQLPSFSGAPLAASYSRSLLLSCRSGKIAGRRLGHSQRGAGGGG